MQREKKLLFLVQFVLLYRSQRTINEVEKAPKANDISMTHCSYLGEPKRQDFRIFWEDTRRNHFNDNQTTWNDLLVAWSFRNPQNFYHLTCSSATIHSPTYMPAWLHSIHHHCKEQKRKYSVDFQFWFSFIIEIKFHIETYVPNEGFVKKSHRNKTILSNQWSTLIRIIDEGKQTTFRWKDIWRIVNCSLLFSSSSSSFFIILLPLFPNASNEIRE